MLSCQNLTLLRHDSTGVLFSDLSFSMPQGAVLYVVGPNGVGKTSFLRVLAGLQKQFAGTITFGASPLSEFTRPLVNYIGHALGITQELTVMEHLDYWAESLGSKSALHATIFYLGLEELLSQKCAVLSSGLRKKVALSRLMLSNRPVWLLDEVEANLDAQNLELLHNMINSKASSGGIIIITTHQQPQNDKSQILNLKDFAKNA